jgi:hypothetical protein
LNQGKMVWHRSASNGLRLMTDVALMTELLMADLLIQPGVQRPALFKQWQKPDHHACRVGVMAAAQSGRCGHRDSCSPLPR